MNENAVHFAQSIRYQPFGSDTDFNFHEIIVGPLNAGPFNRPNLDETFSPERLFYYAPESKEGDMESHWTSRCFAADFREIIRKALNDADTSSRRRCRSHLLFLVELLLLLLLVVGGSSSRFGYFFLRLLLWLSRHYYPLTVLVQWKAHTVNCSVVTSMAWKPFADSKLPESRK